jgi:serpin B
MTTKKPFYLYDGNTISVMMMRQTERFRYASSDLTEALELPYADNDLSMIIFLPAKGTKLQDIKENINTEGLSAWLDRLNKRKVEVHLPRFTMTWEKELTDVLKSMGMANAFSNSADFSGMTGKSNLAISKVIHKAFVEVNEEGTEAAAATGIGMIATSVEPEPPIVFKVDRPFVFLIIDNSTDSILFLGRVENPKA